MSDKYAIFFFLLFAGTCTNFSFNQKELYLNCYKYSEIISTYCTKHQKLLLSWICLPHWLHASFHMVTVSVKTVALVSNAKY